MRPDSRDLPWSHDGPRERNPCPVPGSATPKTAASGWPRMGIRMQTSEFLHGTCKHTHGMLLFKSTHHSGYLLEASGLEGARAGHIEHLIA